MKKNPFSLSFGKEPVSLINRNVQSYEIIDTFEDENPVYQVCMITGVRGSGKTVMLTEINKTFRAEDGTSKVQRICAVQIIVIFKVEDRLKERHMIKE